MPNIYNNIDVVTPMRVGLTGGIGCGKTTVLQQFKQFGVPCFEADAWAGRYYNEPDFLAEVRKHISTEVFLPSGAADKKAIAQLVFHRPDKLKTLCSLIHPRVMKDFDQWTAAQNAPYVIMESAILFEYHFERFMQYTVAVYLEKEERIARLLQRDQTNRAALEARMHNQLSAEEKMNRADFVVLNHEGNPRERQVREIHQRLLQKAIERHQNIV